MKTTRWLTFPDVVRTTALALGLTWKVAVTSVRAWWSRTGTFSHKTSGCGRGVNSMEVEFSGGVVKITVTNEVARRAALRELADQAQELDMDYGSDSGNTKPAP